MRHIVFKEAKTYPVAVLVKSIAFKQQEIENNYITPLNARGVCSQELIAFTLDYDDVGKASATFIKAYLSKLLPALDSLGTQYLYVTDAPYFKVLTRQAKADPHFGYVLPCGIKGFEHMNVVLGLNYQQLIYNPELRTKLTMSLDTLASHRQGNHQVLGNGIIHSAKYPEGTQAIQEALESLHQYPSLTCDIETFSLRFNEAGIGTIAFAWDQHNGLAFPCDWAENTSHFSPDGTEIRPGYGHYKPNKPVHMLLRKFFSSYKGELIFHNAGYDVKVILFTLWMHDLLDTPNLLKGLEIMTRSIQDTKLIAYLATNSTAGNVLGLKSLAHEFAGNYAQEDIKDIRKIPLADLLEYNIVDCLSAWYVKNKYTPIMIQDNQEQIYKEMFLPSMKLLLQTELTGMPMSKAKLGEVKGKLVDMLLEQLNVIDNSAPIKTMNLLVQTKSMETANAKLKVKQHPLEKFADECFNPNSGPQLQRLLYELMGLPVLDYTDTKQPATGADTLEKLINHTKEPSYKALLNALIQHGKVSKVLNTFIPAFERGIEKAKDGIIWLHGSFNLGGTVSGRLSSSDPNLQNIPAGSTFGKLIKEIFTAPHGMLFCGADFNSLEDYISALTTKDKNKLDVYIRGFDGHCLRAAYYFRDQLPHIDLSDPKSVNTIKKEHAQLRQDSKAPTFLLTYGGTYHGMMSNLGWDQDTSQRIEANYHELYKVSDEYVAKRLEQASKDGYVEVAFGLRVRTPLLKQVIWKGSKMPFAAAAEGRTAGNALGQSYGLLNNRAAVEFMQKVWASKYCYDILPVGLIHDSIYLLIKDDIAVVEWVNRELIKSMQWQDLPELHHPTVKLGAELDIFWPDWAHPITIPNEASRKEIWDICQKYKIELKHAA